ncbi:MAG TPA: hypothetical protein VK550_20685 [Polyangiaceae bacterium]|nr:hypothetical protein [Polyangiaceae bacterium]
MKNRILIQLAQLGLRGLAHTADIIDYRLKNALDEVGLPTPERTGGQAFAAPLRGYATRLIAELAKGTRP